MFAMFLCCLLLNNPAMDGSMAAKKPAPKEKSPTRTSVKFKKHENGMVVQAKINNRGPFSFIVDTGAAMTVISSGAAAKAGLRSGGDEVMLVGVGGRPVRGHIAVAREISLGGAKVRRMDVVIYEIPQLRKAGISGLIGQDFLERFDTSFNNRKKILTLSLPDESKRIVPGQKPLGLLEQIAQKVYENPSAPFGSINEITRRAQKYYNLCATGAPPAEDLADFESLLLHNKKRMNDLHSHLVNLPFHQLKPEWNLNVQKSLYCWPDYTSLLNEALALSQQFGVDEVNWDLAAKRIAKITEISGRFACKPAFAPPAWLEDEESGD